MFKAQSRIFLTFFYFFFLILVVSCSNKVLQIQCQDDQRNASCSNSSTENFKYCGWDDQTIQCFRYPCASTYESICEACSVEHVAYVTVGDCNSIEVIKCTPQDRKGDVCPDIYNPVCAKFKCGSSKTLPNSCEACHNKDVISYQVGQCPLEYTSCPTPGHINGQFCAFIVDQVCGVDVNDNQVTYDNKCLACKNPDTIFTYPGQCL